MTAPVENTSKLNRISGLAIASLVLSISAIVIWPFGFIPGIICGHLAKSEMKKNPSFYGHGIAQAGLIVGYTFGGVFLIFLIFFIFLFFIVPLRGGLAPF
jgi:hypothetical protein